jgi:NADPH-dependent 2,4-dienoyl-CoA reductase/sulfur reductase-like enzyme
MPERLVVVGGNAGAMGAASQAKRLRPELEIVAFERGGRTSYAACGIPYFVGHEVESLDRLVARTPEEHRERGIDARLRHDVKHIDLDRRVVVARDLEGDRDVEAGFDQLVIATGARPLRPPLPGIHEPFVRGVTTLDDAEALLHEAERMRSHNVVIVGGGYIGLEMAEAFKRWGAEVMVIDAAPQVMRTLDPDMARLVADAMERMGIPVRTGVAVEGFEPGQVMTADGSVPADLVVLGLGVTPNSELASDAGITLGARNAIAVDDHQRTSADGVWSAGDCCDSFHRVTKDRTYIALGTVANRQARVAGINIGGGDAMFPGVVGTAVTRICETEIGRTGLTEAEARQAGFAFTTAVIDSTTRASYYPGAAPITVKLLAEESTGRIIGGQIVGGAGSAKRIDTVATVIWNEMTANDVINLDLAYAPPFSPVWDPVQSAARKLARPAP